MSNFKNIEKLGLKVETCRNAFGDKDFVINAISLESLLQSAQVVYGVMDQNKPNEFYEFNYYQQKGDTHRALLLCVEPLKKKTKAEAALEFVEKFKSGMLSHVGYLEAEKEAKRILEMKDEV